MRNRRSGLTIIEASHVFILLLLQCTHPPEVHPQNLVAMLRFWKVEKHAGLKRYGQNQERQKITRRIGQLLRNLPEGTMSDYFRRCHPCLMPPSY